MLPRLTSRLLTACLLASGTLGCDPADKSDDVTDPDAGEGGSEDGVGESGGNAEDAFFTPEERQTILAWLGPLPDSPPPDLSNAYADDPAAAILGQKFFFEADYSENGDISCSTCHDPAAAFDESREGNTSEGLTFTDRSSMSVLNGAYAAAAEDETQWQFWDGRSDSQWAQALAPPESAVEMGGTRVSVALLIHGKYRDEYEAIFGPMPTLHDGSGTPLIPEDATPGTEGWDSVAPEIQDAYTEVYVNFGKAIAAYERKLVSRGSRFDAFWEELALGAADSDILTDVEKEGLRAFIGNGRCLGCHSGPNFTDNQFHNTGVPQVGDNLIENDLGRGEGLAIAIESPFNCAGPWSDHPDKSTCGVSNLTPDMGEPGAFKTPSLRDIANRAPYMHTGSMATLDQVIQHYDMGGAAPGLFEGTRDELMRPIGLTSPERQGLAAFMATLTGEPLDPALTEDIR